MLLRGQHAGGGVLSHAARSGSDGHAANGPLDGPGYRLVLPSSKFFVITTNRKIMPRKTSTPHTEPGSSHITTQRMGYARHHDEPGPHSESSLTALSWGTAAFGLAFIPWWGGVGLASAITADFPPSAGWSVPRVGSLPRHRRSQARRRPDHRQPDVQLRNSRRLAHLVNAGFALMIPGPGRRPLSDRTGTAQPGCRLRLDGHRTRLLGRDLPLHRPERPAPRVAVSFARSLQLSISLIAGFCLMAAIPAIQFL